MFIRGNELLLLKMASKIGSRRASCDDYLEFIWIENGTPNPQAIALITEICHPGKYAATYGAWFCQAETVSEVKEQLFSRIGQDIDISI